MIQEFINFYLFFFFSLLIETLYASKMIYAHFVTLSRKKFREGNFSIILWNTINEIELVIAVSEVYIYTPNYSVNQVWYGNGTYENVMIDNATTISRCIILRKLADFFAQIVGNR